MLITKVIEAGIKWLLSLLIPGAGFIKAIMAIKDILVFFVETAIMLIPALIEAIPFRVFLPTIKPAQTSYS
ncbi:MAG: hypothetical protein A3D31_07805 [Candidatus Fluviicola riflensis]|nr:MAG: hypothetical protein CHH17_07205 [Candidatus Fluviicola riflensis]OGS79847.1 MAG: hypothetical protein A3D31_07805 [Candidatus Fluviicola riflensis]OGS82362.1 MAG: hypothetical protein A2724_16750 [Fluviicola sp. RIFCSPHIGHO2_01_FULL_43_53]OGS88026.1 MAG: hypothetical protein A3E30_14185 [Fluviicola sp. RIFCSPHIGHO2_12_FULL_43_24]